jgi:hypothetical protein
MYLSGLLCNISHANYRKMGMEIMIKISEIGIMLQTILQDVSIRLMYLKRTLGII